MIIYISGSDTCLCGKSSSQYIATISLLEDAGATIVNPSNLSFTQMGWSDTLQNRLNELKKCDAILMLPDWKEDVLARIELTAAMDLHLYILFHPIDESELKRILTALDV